MSKQDTLTLTRSGEFAFITKGDKHCGMVKAGERQECRYVVRVKAAASSLDANGYLAEQLVVQAYFDKIRLVQSTCELLSLRVANELEDVFMAENPNLVIKWIEVTLAAAPYAASMTARYYP